MSTPIFYHPSQSVSGVRSFSASAGKPERFVELMTALRFHDYGPHNLGVSVSVTREDLYLAHSKDYIDGLFALTIPNGFGNCDSRIPESCLWTVGSLLSASRHALKYPESPVCAPVSGFHHAGYDSADGFCHVNGLMVVAAKLISENPKFKVAILDVDAHFANGTVDILNHRKDLTKNILHRNNGEHWCGMEDPDEWFIWLQECIDSINAFQPDLVLYQAGADLHIDDDLRNGLLDDRELIQRDRSVFFKIEAPVAWCLAGGYRNNPGGTIFTDPVLNTHRNTLDASNASYGIRKQRLESR